MIGSFNEKATSLIELLKKADKNYLKSLNDKAFEPDSEISHNIEDVVEVHPAMGRNKSSEKDFQKVRFGREWPQEKWYQHKGIPKWHPVEANTPGVQKPKLSDVKKFFPEA
jgi:hypothetical protein